MFVTPYLGILCKEEISFRVIGSYRSDLSMKLSKEGSRR